MEIILARHAGFCFGVNRALALVEEALQDQKKPLYTLGPLVHNQEVIDRLGQQGVKILDSPTDVQEGFVVIRAHGLPPAAIACAAKHNLTVIDATCPYVRKAQELAKELASDGYQVVIIGERDHAEVRALVGWAGEGTIVIECPEEVKAITGADRVGVIVQTTQTRANVDSIITALTPLTRELKVHNTICSATRERQDEAAALAKKVDCMVVIGGRNSANTKRLVDICALSAPKTVWVESNRELAPEWFKGCRRAGVTAGASTPAWLIKEVIEKMEEFGKENEQEELEQTVETVGAEPEASPEAVEPAPEQEEKESDDFAGYEDTFRNLQEGEIVKGVIMSVSHDEILVDVGYKSEGVLPMAELSKPWLSSPAESVKRGDVIDVYIVSVEDNEGKLVLSKKRADEARAFETIQAAYQNGDLVRGTVKQVVKGGMLADVGLSGFVPASQADRRYVKDLSDYVGQELEFAVIEIDPAKRRVVLSRRKAMEESESRQRTRTLAELAEGQVRPGTVKSLTSFGAFVDLGGVDGLLHISELSWGRIGHPSEVVAVGDRVEVMVLGIDQEKGRISLGLKQVQADPWTLAVEKYPVGTVLTGKVARLVNFGAFVELEPGVDGLVHISQMAERRIGKPEDVVHPGDQVAVKVISVRPEERKIGLSMIEVEQDKEKAEVQAYLDRQDGPADPAAVEAGPEVPAGTGESTEKE